MKYTFDLPEKTKGKLEDIKRTLKREKLRGAFEEHIVDFLILHADLDALRTYFTDQMRRREREKAGRSTKVSQPLPQRARPKRRVR